MTTQDNSTVVPKDTTIVEGSNPQGSQEGNDKKPTWDWQPKGKSDALNRLFQKQSDTSKEFKSLKDTISQYDERFKKQEEVIKKLSEMVLPDEAWDGKNLSIDEIVAKAVQEALKKNGEGDKTPEDTTKEKEWDWTWNKALDSILASLPDEYIQKLSDIDDSVWLDDDLLLKHLSANRKDIAKAIDDYSAEQKQIIADKAKEAETISDGKWMFDSKKIPTKESLVGQSPQNILQALKNAMN